MGIQDCALMTLAVGYPSHGISSEIPIRENENRSGLRFRTRSAGGVASDCPINCTTWSVCRRMKIQLPKASKLSSSWTESWQKDAPTRRDTISVSRSEHWMSVQPRSKGLIGIQSGHPVSARPKPTVCNQQLADFQTLACPCRRPTAIIQVRGAPGRWNPRLPSDQCRARQARRLSRGFFLGLDFRPSPSVLAMSDRLLA